MFFKDVIGQTAAKKRLISAVQNNMVSHAMLFAEQEGNGALPLALALSQYLLCKDKGADDSCGQCPSCIKLAKVAHPDLHFAFPIILSGAADSDKNTSNNYLNLWNETIIEQPYLNLHDWQDKLGNTQKKSVISVNQSHEVIKKISLKAFDGGYKIMLVWMAENANIQASNKLLKLLEEPPDKTVFMLISQKMDSIISTITSRTQLGRLVRPSVNEISQSLVSKENIDPSVAQQAATMANGNYSLALRMCDPELNNTHFQPFVDWMRLCFKKDVVGLVNWSNDAASIGRQDQKGFLYFALDIIKQSITQNYVGESHVNLMKQEHAFLKKFAAFINGNNIIPIVQKLEENIYHIDRNANSKILFLDLSLSIAKLL